MSQKIIDPKLCPLCGEPNRCERVVDESATSCWCTEVLFSEELRSQVPEQLRMEACICRTCADSNLEAS